MSHYYQLDQSISVLRVVRWYFTFLFKFQLNILSANSGDTDQTPHSMVSDLGLHCLPIFVNHQSKPMLLMVMWSKLDPSFQYSQQSCLGLRNKKTTL